MIYGCTTKQRLYLITLYNLTHFVRSDTDYWPMFSTLQISGAAFDMSAGGAYRTLEELVSKDLIRKVKIGQNVYWHLHETDLEVIGYEMNRWAAGFVGATVNLNG